MLKKLTYLSYAAGYLFRTKVLRREIPFIGGLVMGGVAIVSWKRELAGAAAFPLFGCFHIWMIGLDKPFSWYAFITFPAFIIGVLFLFSPGWLKENLSKYLLK